MQLRKTASTEELIGGEEGIESPARRRFLRMGGIAAAGAAVAAVATASPAGAGVDGDLTLGSVVNTATSATGLSVTGTAALYGLGVTDNGGSGLNGRKPSILAHAKSQNFTTALYALGEGANVIALRAESPDGGAIVASCASGFSTIKVDNGGGGAAVEASTSNGNAVEGSVLMGAGAGVAALTYGSGPAITATTVSSTNPSAALRATSASAAPAVKAIGKTVPVSAAVPIAGNAAALAVQGVATFTRSGVAALAAAGASIVVSVAGGLTANSHVLATLQTNVAGVAVRAVVPNPANGKITIFLTASAPAATKIAWFVFG